MKKTANNVPVMPVIKADAYGHGAPAVASALAEKGADRFAVVTQEEALQLRQNGLRGLILLMGIAPPLCIPALQQADITLCVPGLETAKTYAAAAGGKPLKVHVKLDTGMGRLGMLEEQAPAEILAISKIPGIEITGIFTQLSSSDLPGEDGFTRAQHEVFGRIVAKLAAEGLYIPLHHCANSAATMGLPDTHEGMVRNGLPLYGYQSREEDVGADIRPVLAWRSSIVQCKELPAGSSVGYDRGYRAPGARRVAVVPVGYADGLSRALSLGKGQMLVRGQRAPIIGKICMDMCMLDVSEIEFAGAGDLVTIIGQDGEEHITADDIAKALGTISYEILCCIGKRVPRIYRRKGKLDRDNPYWFYA